MESNLRLYIYNDAKCYSMISKLSECLSKKVKKGIELDEEKLANSSIVGKIISEAKNEMIKLGESIKPTREDVKEMRGEIARYIIEEYIPYL